jgi:hypothetical protein
MEDTTTEQLKTAIGIICDLLARLDGFSPYWVPEDYRELQHLIRESGIRPSNAPSDDHMAKRINY